MAVITNHDAYNYYLSTYIGSAGKSRYDSHKKNDLKNVYKKIVSNSKDAPLYKIKRQNEATRFAIDLKENARITQNLVSSLQTEGDDIESIFYRKIATSSNEDAVGVEYIPSQDAGVTDNGFTLGVSRLAQPQVNTGNFLSSTGRDFEEGTHSFDLDTALNSYEFHYHVGTTDTNRNVMQKIARLINTSDVGLSAKIIDRGNESSLELVSKQTGLAEDENYLFDIHSSSSYNELSTLGIANVSQPAVNSRFTLNGTPHESLSNNFTINRAFDITLNDTTPDEEPAKIGFKAGTEAMADSVDDLIHAYNGFVALGRSYSQSHQNSTLLGEVGRIYRSMSMELSEVGIGRDENEMLTLDRDKIADAITNDESKSSFSTLNRFKNALSREADKTAIDPLNYVDRIPVAYKNPEGKNYVAPYATSRYAGLLVDQVL